MVDDIKSGANCKRELGRFHYVLYRSDGSIYEVTCYRKRADEALFCYLRFDSKVDLHEKRIILGSVPPFSFSCPRGVPLFGQTFRVIPNRILLHTLIRTHFFACGRYLLDRYRLIGHLGLFWRVLPVCQVVAHPFRRRPIFYFSRTTTVVGAISITEVFSLLFKQPPTIVGCVPPIDEGAYPFLTTPYFVGGLKGVITTIDWGL